MSKIDKEVLLAAVRKHGKYAFVARELGVSTAVVGRVVSDNAWSEEVAEARMEHAAGKRAVSELEQVQIDGVGELPLGALENILKKRGLDGSKFVVTQLRVGEWEAQEKDGGTKTLYSIRAGVIPKGEWITRATGSGKKPILAPKMKPGKKQTFVCLADQHIPWHDRDLHAHVLAHLKDLQPDRIILLGDLMDLDSMSRHPWDASFNATFQDTLDQTHDYLKTLRDTCPKAQIDYLLGNHEDRARQKIIDRIRELYSVRRVGTDYSSLSLEWLLALDELGIVLHTDEDRRYDHTQLRIAADLVARHGSKTRTGGGGSVLAEMQRTTHGVVMGHCHRLSVVRRTVNEQHGTQRVLLGAEAGTLAARVGAGLGYATLPDWQQGYLVITVGEDEFPCIETVVAHGGRLHWRGEVW